MNELKTSVCIFFCYPLQWGGGDRLEIDEPGDRIFSQPLVQTIIMLTNISHSSNMWITKLNKMISRNCITVASLRYCSDHIDRIIAVVMYATHVRKSDRLR